MNRIRIALATALTLAAADQAVAQCSLSRPNEYQNTEWLGSDPGTDPFFNIDRGALTGRIFYVIVQDRLASPNTYGLAAVDFSNPTLPVALGRGPTTLFEDAPFDINTFTQTFEASAASGSIYALTFQGDLRLFDMTDPANAQQRGTLVLPGDITEIVADGDVLFVVSGGTLYVVDIVNPDTPVAIAQAPNVTEIGASSFERLPAVANGVLTIFDVSDPRSLDATIPTLGTFPGSGTLPEIVGNAAVLYSPTLQQFQIYDISDPTQIVELSPFADPLVPFSDFTQTSVTATSGFFLFASQQESRGNGLAVPAVTVDFRDPSAPVVVAQINEIFGLVLSVDVFIATPGLLIAGEPNGTIALFDTGGCSAPPAVAGGANTFEAEDGGTPVTITMAETNGVNFEWFLDGLPVADGPVYSGASTPSLTITPTASAAGTYQLKVSNTDGEALGPVTTLGIRPGFDAADFNRDGVVDIFDVIDLITISP